MWYGKVSLIMFIFSFALTFMMYYVNTAFNSSDVAANWNEAAVTKLLNNLTVTQQSTTGQAPNPALIFGDFVLGIQVLFSIIAGGGVVSVIQHLPFVNIAMLYLVQIIYFSSSVLLWIFMIANRSV